VELERAAPDTFGVAVLDDPRARLIV